MAYHPLTYWNQRFETFGHTGFRNWDVHCYDQRLRLRAVTKVLRKLGKKIESGSFVLDVGCGTGDFIAEFSARGASVTGVDISPSLIENVRKRFASQPRVNLTASPIQNFAFELNHFDLILSITVLQHLTSDEELQEVTRKMASALKPGGILIALEASGQAGSGSETEYLRVRDAATWKRVFHNSGLRLASDVTYPQSLQLALKALNRLRAFIPRSAKVRPVEGSEKRAGSSVVQFIMKCLEPLDRFISAMLPISLFPHRIFVLQKEVRS